MRNCLIVANWKLNNNQITIKKFFQTLKNTNIITINTKCHIAIAPSTIYLYIVKKYIKQYPNINIAAQDVDIHLSGAFTGETSVTMLEEIGVKYVIIGHSERRKYHKETNEHIVKKFDVVKQTDKLTPILCIGENKEEKKNGQTKSVCEQQLNTILRLLGPKSFENSVIAYEPIWAIGTGVTETPKNIQKIHKFIRDYIKSYDHKTAKKIIIQYGGSVNQNNAKNLLMQPDIDGALIGNASLHTNTFISIIEDAEKIKK